MGLEGDIDGGSQEESAVGVRSRTWENADFQLKACGSSFVTLQAFVAFIFLPYFLYTRPSLCEVLTFASVFRRDSAP